MKNHRESFRLGLAIGRFTASLCVLICSTSYAQVAAPRWSAPPIKHAISIRNGKTGERISYQQYLAEISKADVVFLGESHTDETTHRFQLATYQSLLKSKKQKVVLALEMFERDVQGQLDAYLNGEIEEQEFLANSNPWSNYHEAYRPLVEQAKQAGTPVVAANFPKSLRRKLAMQGAEELESFSEQEKKWLPKQFLPNSSSYWQRTDNATRGHQGFAMPGHDDDERLYSTQSLWDNAMGEACADALDQYPGHSVLHLNGKFHTAYWDGTAHQLRLRKPEASIKTVSITPTLNPATAPLEGKPVADYVVFVESLATNIEEGEHSVQIGRELKYRFHFPEGMNAGSRVPLLIWLSDDDLTAKEGMRLCREQFGKEAAIAVIEAPYKSIGEDLAVGGRWFWPETFAEDVTALVEGTESIWAYLMRHYSIDPERVCVVGEGAGATVAAVIAMHTERMDHQAIAIQPRRYAKVKDLPLLLPDYFGETPMPQKMLKVIAKESIRSWWQKEIDQYSSVRVPSEFLAIANDPWESDLQITKLICESLDIASQLPPEQKRQFLLLENNSPRALHWGRLQATKLSRAGSAHTVAVHVAPQNVNATQVPTNITAEVTARAGVLPRCPGPFGGTTVLVIPDETSPEELTKWRAIESDDPLAATSRFHRVRIATRVGDRNLPAVLDKLRSENRKNILIVPAKFYADVTWLRTIKQTVIDYEDSMTIQWLPGLGGRPGIVGK